MAKLLNCTPHPIVIIVDGKEVVIPPSGITIRLENHERIVDPIVIDGVKIPVSAVWYEGVSIQKDGKTLGFREFKEIALNYDGLIVPQLLAPYKGKIQSIANIPIYAPNTNKAVRDESGKIIGVKGLILL